MKTAILTLLLCGTAACQSFNMTCHPFKDLEKQHPIDASCAVNGSAAKNTGGWAQNAAKNNFCGKGTPKKVSAARLTALQGTTADKIPDSGGWGDTNLPKDRSDLKDAAKLGGLGEGQLVELEGYLFEAHAADTTSGESVNCGFGSQKKGTKKVSSAEAPAYNDLHIAVVQKKTEKNECNSVTAEMSPHLRPEGWTAETINGLKGKHVRFTGQLFYDASHHVCENGKAKGGQPKRASNWEVHPVYVAEVCKQEGTAGKCTQWGAVE